MQIGKRKSESKSNPTRLHTAITAILLVCVCNLSYDRYASILASREGNTAVVAKNKTLEESSSSLASAAAATSPSPSPREPRLGDGCYHVFLDIGANIGVHGRFLYEPHKYPNSRYSVPLFEKEYGSNRDPRDFCVFEFEANSKHWPRLQEVAASYSKQGWRYHVIEAAVSDYEGFTTFFHQGPKDEKFQEWGFSGAKNFGMEGAYEEKVPTIRLSEWIRHHILEREVPGGPPSGTSSDENNNNAKPILSFKMDIEGYEYVVLPDMIHEGIICGFEFAFGEFHPKLAPIRTFNGKDNTNSSSSPDDPPLHRVSLESAQLARQYASALTQTIESSRHCSTHWLNIDDESYLRDGLELP